MEEEVRLKIRGFRIDIYDEIVISCGVYIHWKILMKGKSLYKKPEIARNGDAFCIVSPKLLPSETSEPILDCIMSAATIVCRENLHIKLRFGKAELTALLQGNISGLPKNSQLQDMIFVLTDPRVVRQTHQEIEKSEIIITGLEKKDIEHTEGKIQIIVNCDLQETPREIADALFDILLGIRDDEQSSIGRKPLKNAQANESLVQLPANRLDQLKQFKSFLIGKYKNDLFDSHQPPFQTVDELADIIKKSYDIERLSNVALGDLFRGKTKKMSPTTAKAILLAIRGKENSEENERLFREYLKQLWGDSLINAMDQVNLQEKN